MGIAVVLSGIELMILAMEPLSATMFYQKLYIFSKGAPWKGIITGALVAAILQSSSVTIGMVVCYAEKAC